MVVSEMNIAVCQKKQVMSSNQERKIEKYVKNDIDNFYDTLA